MNYDTDKYVKRLQALKFVPTQTHALAAIADILAETCPDETDAERLISAMLRRFNEWPGPSRMREMASEILARTEARPAGCVLCRDLEGLRRVFRVDEMIPGKEKRTAIIDPNCGLIASMAQEAELRALYCGSKTHQFYNATKFCSCPLGTLQKAEFGNARS